jgi:hypothetical protein
VTAARTAGVAATFTTEFDCDRACQVEFQLDDVHVRFTLGQMLGQANRAHTEAHAADVPVKVFPWHGPTLVRAAVLPAVADA